MMVQCEWWVVGWRGPPHPDPLPEERENYRQVWGARVRRFRHGKGGREGSRTGEEYD